MAGYVATDAAAYERSMGRWSRRLAEPSSMRAAAARRGAARCRLRHRRAGRGDRRARRHRAHHRHRHQRTLPRRRARPRAGRHLPPRRHRRAARCRRRLRRGAVAARAAIRAGPAGGGRGTRSRHAAWRGIVAAAMWDFVGGFTFVRAFADSARGERAGRGGLPHALPRGFHRFARAAHGALFQDAGLAGVAERDIAIRQDFTGPTSPTCGTPG
jgi:hypothetical protein